MFTIHRNLQKSERHLTVAHIFLCGPENQIVVVVLRFRLKEVAFVADIKSSEGTSTPKISTEITGGWKDCDLSKEVKDYKMCSYIGGASSPSCSN